MTDDEAKTAILERLTARPVAVGQLTEAAAAVLTDEPNRARAFAKWAEKHGAAVCAALNRGA